MLFSAHNSRLVQRGMIFVSMALIFIILGVVGELIAAALTGRDRRDYPVLPPDSTLQIDGEAVSLATYAARYLPEIRIDPTHIPPRIDQILYQASERDGTIILVYYADWSNEIHPNAIMHWLYENYRRAVYGSEHDIEYLELTIDTASGIVQRVRFETAEPGDYNRRWTVHQFAFVDRAESGDGYVYCILDEESACVSDEIFIDGVWNADRSPIVGVMTWNHLYTLLHEGDVGSYTDTVRAPLTYLTEDVYREQKMARRSQGDLKTELDNTLRTRLRVVFWSLSAILTLLVGYGGLRR